MNLQTYNAYLQFHKNFSLEERIIICGFRVKIGQRMTIYTSSIQHSESECNAGAMNNIMIAT
jgi:hypothetical protein